MGAASKISPRPQPAFEFEAEQNGGTVSAWERDGAEAAHSNLVLIAKSFIAAAQELRDFGVETVGPWSWSEMLPPITDTAECAPCWTPSEAADESDTFRAVLGETQRIAAKAYAANAAKGDTIARMMAETAGKRRAALRSAQAQDRAIRSSAYAMTLAAIEASWTFTQEDDA